MGQETHTHDAASSQHERSGGGRSVDHRTSGGSRSHRRRASICAFVRGRIHTMAFRASRSTMRSMRPDTTVVASIDHARPPQVFVHGCMLNLYEPHQKERADSPARGRFGVSKRVQGERALSPVSRGRQLGRGLRTHGPFRPSRRGPGPRATRGSTRRSRRRRTHGRKGRSSASHRRSVLASKILRTHAQIPAHAHPTTVVGQRNRFGRGSKGGVQRASRLNGTHDVVTQFPFGFVPNDEIVPAGQVAHVF